MYYEEKSPIRQSKRARIISMNSSKKNRKVTCDRSEKKC